MNEWKEDDAMKIRTNRAWREFRSRHEVPRKILDNEMDWCYSEVGFFKYLGTWYHTSQFMRHDIHGRADEMGWHGSHADSAFSGVLIKLSSDGACYQVARYSS